MGGTNCCSGNNYDDDHERPEKDIMAQEGDDF